jgi:DNA primase
MMDIAGQSFVETLKDLAERANYTLPALTSFNQVDDGPSKAALYEIMNAAQGFYAERLKSQEGKEALDYLRGRGLSADSINLFGVGLAPKEWDRLNRYLEAQKFSRSVAVSAGLIKQSRNADKYYDTFRNRITFPINDTFPRVLAFAARLFGQGEEGPKYINSPTTDIYEKGHQLYGFNLARPHIKSGGIAFLVEGYMDVISMFAGGVKSTVAAMGTALTQYQVNALKGQAKEVILVFDSDNAGVAAAKRAIPLLYNADLDGRVILLPDGHDPDTFIREFGAQAFYELADKAQDLSEFFISRLLSSDAKTVTGMGRIVTEMQDILRQVPDAVKGQFLRNQLAERLNLPPDLLNLKSVEKVNKPSASSKPLPKTDYNKVAESLLKFIITHKECLSGINESLLDIWPEDRTKRVLESLIDQVKNNPRNPDIRLESMGLEDDPLMSSMVSGAMVRSREYSASESHNVAKNLVGKIRNLYDRNLREEYTQAIKQAEAIGDHETVEKLMAAKPR